MARDQILSEVYRYIGYEAGDKPLDASSLNEISRSLGDFPLDALVENTQFSISVLSTFIPQRYEGDLLLFTATDSEGNAATRPEAWRPYISGEIEVHQVLLCSEAESWGADSIFVGSRGLSGMERFLIGSVSFGVAARAHCSVEVIRVLE
jgi:nucleotide-binding universal stress UspA family protein